MTEPKTPTRKPVSLKDNYRPLALPAVAAAYAVRRPVAAAAAGRAAGSGIGHGPVDGFWTVDHDSDL